MRYVISAPLKLLQRGLGILFMAALGVAAIAIGAVVLTGSIIGLILIMAWFLFGFILMLIGQALNAMIVVIDPLHGTAKKEPIAGMMRGVSGFAGRHLN